MKRVTQNKLVKQYADYILKGLGYNNNGRWRARGENLLYQPNRRVVQYPEFWEKLYTSDNITYEYVIEEFLSITSAWILMITRIKIEDNNTNYKTLAAIPLDLDKTAEENLTLYNLAIL